MVYAAFLLVLGADLSLISTVVPLSAWLYALLAQRKPQAYWRVRAGLPLGACTPCRFCAKGHVT